MRRASSAPDRPTSSAVDASLSLFRPATQAWFEASFAAPTAAQVQGWPAIASGAHTLICAPTGSGKTLAAFLWCLDRLIGSKVPDDPMARLRLLYVSPLKALVHDIERNLRAPLTGITLAAQARGERPAPIQVAMRTGDTPADERRAFNRRPPDLLVTTPESLYLLLTSSAREALRSTQWVIVDEIHALAGTKRGAHLALSLERLEAMTVRPPQRIGLSATQRPLSTVASFLGGRQVEERVRGTSEGSPSPSRPVTIVDAGIRKPLEIEIVVPVEEMGRLGQPIPLDEAPGGPAAGPTARFSIWPAIHPRILELIRAHRSTIVFVNSRRLAERLAQQLNELAGEELVRAHHGSLAREQRVQVEEALKQGTVPALVATSSLELGIDMGDVDLVIQVESPLSVARGLQRVGRAGHRIDEPSRGVVFPKYRGDLLECAVVVRRMREGAIESTVIPRHPLDVLAQQIVAAAVERPWPVDALFALVRRAENFAELGRDSFDAVLGMLAGHYAGDEFAALRPRIVWDRLAGTVSSRRDARTIAILSGGTIPDRGMFGVYLTADETGPADPSTRTRARAARSGGRRVGELDEEMVYEARPGEVILLGASAWRIEEIARDRVLVSPAPGEPGRVPFWRGDSEGRPLELGQAIGAFTREFGGLESGGPRSRATAQRRLREEHDLDELAARNLLGYLQDEREATGVLPTDKTIVVERFRDELGDWRVCLLTPFGARVHAPWALAIESRLRQRLGIEIQPIWSDDGIVLRLPDTSSTIGLDGRGSEADAVEAAIAIPPDEVDELVISALGSSALFASRFRENASRALLLPRARPGVRMPLWQMRQRASQLLSVASRYRSFPILLETYRECLQDVFDLPGLRGLLAGIERRELRIASVETTAASPFASSLMMDYIAAYMYAGDAPLLDRRAQALSLDRDLLRELLGSEEVRELLDAEALAELELELQALTAERAAGSADQVHDLLRRLGDLTATEVAARVRGADAPERARVAQEWLEVLRADHRAIALRVAGEERWIAAEEAGRYRDALGVSPPPGTPAAFLEREDDPLSVLAGRWARHHGPFHATEPATRWGASIAAVDASLERLLAGGTLVRGAFRPGGTGLEWCDAEVLRMLKRRSLARLRRQIEPVDAPAYARFLQRWQDIGVERGGISRLVEVIEQLEGLPLPVSVLEHEILPARIRDYAPSLLDELGAAGEVAWVGAGSLGRDDGRVALYRPDRLAALQAPELTSAVAGTATEAVADVGGPVDDDWVRVALRDRLEQRGPAFYRDLMLAVVQAATARGASLPSERTVLDQLWDLVWAGIVTNDTFAPLRALRWPGGKRGRPTGRPRSGARFGPPEAAGRWSLVREAIASAVALRGGRELTETERRHRLVLGLLERQGVVTRESIAAENVPGGFAAVYPVFREMEERGQVRRGYFIEGQGGAQFALPVAVDRLRAERGDPGGARAASAADARVLAATDPASPWGASVPWPRWDADDRRPIQRAAGAYVIAVDGEPVLYLERSGRSLQTFPASVDPDRTAVALGALGALSTERRVRRLQIERVDGRPVSEWAMRDQLAEAGFRSGYRGWVWSPEAHAGSAVEPRGAARDGASRRRPVRD